MTDKPNGKPALAGIAALNAKIASEVPGYAEGLAATRGAHDYAQALRMKLIESRKNRRIDQTEIANRMGITQSAVSKIETGTGDIGLQTLFRYARALELTLRLDLVPATEEKAKARAAMPEKVSASYHLMGEVMPYKFLSNLQMTQDASETVYVRQSHGMHDDAEAPFHITFGFGERQSTASSQVVRNFLDSTLGGKIQALGEILTESIDCPVILTDPGVDRTAGPRLTPRERECLTLAGLGKTSEEIARMLDLPSKLVILLLETAFRKMLPPPSESTSKPHPAPSAYFAGWEFAEAQKPWSIISDPVMPAFERPGDPKRR